MNKSNNLINKLPKELQLLISEYNVEHKPKFNESLKLIKENPPERLTCYVCDITKIAPVHYSYILETFVCSKKCQKEFIHPPFYSRRY